MNWLVTNNQELKLFESKSSLKGSMILKRHDKMGVMLTLPKYLRKQEVPYLVQFTLPDCPHFQFKMIKYLFLP